MKRNIVILLVLLIVLIIVIGVFVYIKLTKKKVSVMSVMSSNDPVPKITTIGDNGHTYEFIMQQDGNAVLYDNNKAIWSTGKPSSRDYNPPYTFKFQPDGNWVVYDKTGPYWSAKVANKGTPPYKLVLQADRNLVSYDANNNAITSTHTNV